MTVVALLALAAVHLYFLLAPGLVLAAIFRRRWPFPAPLTALVAVAFSGLLGYLVFWAYFAGPRTGRAASAGVLLAGAACLVSRSAWAAVLRPGEARREAGPPIALMYVVCVFYLALLFTVRLPDTSVPMQGRDRFPALYLAIDNILPETYSELMYLGEDVRQFPVGDWLSSDRPPLQTGLVLAHRPLADVTGQGYRTHYLVLASLLQLSWVPALWALVRLAGLDGRRSARALALAIVTGFFLFHSVFVWPKMLAGALGVLAVALLLFIPEQEGGQHPALAALAAALGVLAHGGVAFTLLALAPFLLRPRYFPGVRGTLAGLAVFVGILAPWLNYQRNYDPPGNRLVKWHIGGVIPIDDRPAGQTIVDSYRALSPGQVLANKGANVLALVGRPFIVYEHDYAQDLLGQWRNGEYYYTGKTLGLLNLGWLMLLFRRPDPASRQATRMLALGLVALGVWLALMFGPGTTVVYQGSFATMLLIFAGLGTLMSGLGGWLWYPVLGVQAVQFVVIWLADVPTDHRGPHTGMIALAGAAGLLLAGCLVGLGRLPLAVQSAAPPGE